MTQKPILAALAAFLTFTIVAPAEAKIHRSSSARYEFKKMHPCPATGLPRGACPGYVIDHIVPLKRGGADHPANMQWQSKEDAKAKDKWE